ncbi:MAG: hypothetical protein PUJ87_00180 [Prevotellaceae bacterium]|nr:hypothetical protein [Prevotella sp.]MDD7605098.1 hypothetical protein [Prevotellaceae bacterium]
MTATANTYLKFFHSFFADNAHTRAVLAQPTVAAIPAIAVITYETNGKSGSRPTPSAPLSTLCVRATTYSPTLPSMRSRAITAWL